MNNFNTQTLLSEINTIINNGVKDIVKDYMKRHALLEETHNVLVNLPAVREYYNSENTCEITDNKVSVKIEKDIYLAKSEFMQYMKNMDEKMNILLKQMGELKNEIDILKINVDKEIISIHKCLDVEKENIKLEIVDIKQENLEYALNECKVEETKEIEQYEDEEENVADEELAEEEDEEVVSVETETKKEDFETEDEEEELIEIEIDDITYCTNNEDNGIIYELDKEGNVGKKVGYLKDGEAYFDE